MSNDKSSWFYNNLEIRGTIGKRTILWDMCELTNVDPPLDWLLIVSQTFSNNFIFNKRGRRNLICL